MVAHRLRRWPIIKLTLAQHLVFAGLVLVHLLLNERGGDPRTEGGPGQRGLPHSHPSVTGGRCGSKSVDSRHESRKITPNLGEAHRPN